MIERDNGAISHSLTGSYKRASGCFFSVTNFGTMSRNMCNLQCPREILMDLLHQKKSFWEISTTFLTQCLVVRMLSSIFIAEIFHPFKIHLILELFSTLKSTSLEFLYELKLSFFWQFISLLNLDGWLRKYYMKNTAILDKTLAHVCTQNT